MNLQQFEIKRLFEEEHLSAYRISKLLGITQSRVRQALRESGVEYSLIFNDSDEMKEIIELFQEGKTFREIESITGKTYTHIRVGLIERGYTETKTPDVTPEMIEKIIKLYSEGNSSSKVAKLLGISATTVKKFVPKEIKKKKAFYNIYSCNYQFFENIDNEVSAYFLGLFYADGYNNQQTSTIRLGFAKKDKELLDKFLIAIESNHPIKITDRGGNSQVFLYVDISSKILSDDLAKQGCVQGKTHLLKTLPEMEESLIRHFIRGYFDGDGSVWYSLVEDSKDKINLSFTGNKPFLLKLQEVLVCELGVGQPSIYIRHKERGNDIGDLRYSSEQARKILEWMYNDCQYYSERKKEISLKQKFEEELI